ncbi:MAG: CDP-alcohol phosphatidyltransferase family protein [Deltaproteobacteria bacterium]|nr:CDP-alcohol phosphatidyltransferase family protein [Nannocystaceae bacterium]
MVNTPIQQAVLLATHAFARGRRTIPTALVRCGGITLLKRAMLTLARNGVRRFVIVMADTEVRRAAEADKQLAGLEVVWVHNAERPADDAYSLFRARPHLRGEFFVAPVDRVFSGDVLKALLAGPLEGATLAVAKADRPALPPADQTVELHLRDRVAALGGRADACTTGVFTADRSLFDALDRRDEGGELRPLGEAIAELATHGTVRAADIGDAWWHPVRNTLERQAAQAVLIRSLRKSVDGLIARHINRRFSLAATRLLMNTPVRPNHVTAFSLLVSVAAAVTAAWATAASPWWLAVGAVLWQLASMLDGIDGELARLKFQGSKLGEWFDTLTDDVGRFVLFIGSGIGVAAVTGQPIWMHLCTVTALLQMALAINLYRKLIKTGSGSHYALAWQGNNGAQARDSKGARFMQRVEFLARRDYYVFLWMLLAMGGLIKVGIIINTATTLCIAAHELLRPRQAREEFVSLPPG